MITSSKRWATPSTDAKQTPATKQPNNGVDPHASAANAAPAPSASANATSTSGGAGLRARTRGVSAARPTPATTTAADAPTGLATSAKVVVDLRTTAKRPATARRRP